MQAREAELLENVLDALDRLYDGHCGAVDVWALLTATGAALKATAHSPVLDETAAALEPVWRKVKTADAQRDQALGVTDPLRQYLARLLPWPG